MANFLSNGDAILLFPDSGQIIHVQEGSGDNLLKEDIAAGYIDYFDWTSYKPTVVYDLELEEVDGGMALFRKFVKDLSNDELINALKFEASLGPDAAYKVIEPACPFE